MIDITIPGLMLPSCANLREHWATRSRRVRKQRDLVTLVLRRTVVSLMPVAGPLEVTITRVAPRRLDSDNAVSACKGVRDAVALLLGVDDRDDDVVCWRVEQAKGPPGVRVRINGRLETQARPGAA